MDSSFYNKCALKYYSKVIEGYNQENFLFLAYIYCRHTNMEIFMDKKEFTQAYDENDSNYYLPEAWKLNDQEFEDIEDEYVFILSTN
jgi:hypothetical protein